MIVVSRVIYPSCFVQRFDHRLYVGAVAMRLKLRPEWRLRPIRSFLGFLDLKSGARPHHDLGVR